MYVDHCSCVSHRLVLAAVQNRQTFCISCVHGEHTLRAAPIVQKVQVSDRNSLWEFEFGGPSACLFVSLEVTDLSEQFITALTLPSFGIGVEIRNVTEMVFVQVHVHCAFMYAGAHIYSAFTVCSTPLAMSS